MAHSNDYRWFFDNYFTYKKTFNDSHNIDVTLGIVAEENKYETLYGSRINVPADENLNFNSSPILEIKYSRIKSNLDLTSNLYYSYQQKLEELYLEEKSTLSGLIVIDKPYIADKPAFPNISFYFVFLLFSIIFINSPILIYKKY